MGLKKTHEHESGFFEENILTRTESNKNRFKLTAEEKMRSPQQRRDLSRGQANMIDSCNNVSENYEKLRNKLNNCNNYANTQTIVIDSDDDDDDDIGNQRFADQVVVSTTTNGHCSSNPDPDVVDVADDSDDPDEMRESIQVRIGDNHIDDSGDDDVDIDGSSNMLKHHQQHHHQQYQLKNQHIASQPSAQSKSSNTSSNNNKVNKKSKNGDTDAKSSIHLMQEIEEASTIRPQGEFNQFTFKLFDNARISRGKNKYKCEDHFRYFRADDHANARHRLYNRHIVEHAREVINICVACSQILNVCDIAGVWLDNCRNSHNSSSYRNNCENDETK